MVADLYEAACATLGLAVFGGLISLLSMLLGGFIGHRLSLGRDRRQQCNKAKATVRELLFMHRGRTSTSKNRLPTEFEYDTLEQLLPFWQRLRFRKALAHYEECRHDETPNASGYMVFSDPARVNSALEKLIRHTDWR